MIAGHVLNLEARVPLILRLPNRQNLEIEFVVDTGFAGFLTLPPDAVIALALPYRETISANLASDDAIDVDTHRATIVWEGVEREVDILALGSRPLLGTALMNGKDLLVQFAENGLVTIEDI